jgi:hypothetical protein
MRRIASFGIASIAAGATVTVQEHERGRMRLGQNDCLQGKKEIPKESSDLSYLHSIHKVALFTNIQVT